MSSAYPSLSVVIGAYNCVATIDETLGSVLRQANQDTEVVVVDDGSTDDMPRLLAAWSASDRRLRVIRQDNAGLTRALVRGCSAARGDYIARQDVGDLSLPGRFRLQLTFLDAHPECSMVACGHRVRAPYGEIMDEVRWEDGGAALTRILRAARVEELQTPHHGSVMFRRDAYERVGGYRPAFYFSQDLDLWMRLVEVGDLGMIDEVLYEVAL